ncbi:MAG: ribosome maturation factor [Chitinophagaceae bacterium]
MLELTPQEQQIADMLLPFLEDSDMFLTRIHIKPTNNIKVFLDADSGLNIAKCAAINRKLYHAIEETALYPDGDFSLEVSSPGVDEPLTSPRQYQKNVGRTVEVTLVDGTVHLGQMQTVNETGIVLHIKGTKKEAPKEIELAFEAIKTAIVQVTF